MGVYEGKLPAQHIERRIDSERPKAKATETDNKAPPSSYVMLTEQLVVAATVDVGALSVRTAMLLPLLKKRCHTTLDIAEA